MKLEEKMFALVEQWTASALSKSAFVKIHSISIHKFDYWRKKYDLQHRPAVNMQKTFIEIKPEGTIQNKTNPVRLEFELPDGTIIRIY